MKSVEIPVYSFVEHQRTKETQYLYGASVVILEGLFILSDPALRKLMDMKVFGKFLGRFSSIVENALRLGTDLVFRSRSFNSSSGLRSYVSETDTQRHYRKRERCAGDHHTIPEM